jgi:hypothetical protein
MAKVSQGTKLTLSIGLSVVFLYLAVYKPQFAGLFSRERGILDAFFGSPRFNFAELGSVLRNAEWRQIAVAGVIFFASLIVRAWRWQQIMISLVKMPFWQVFGAMNIGYLANNVLPFRLGELYKAQVVYQLSGLSRTEAFGTIIVERLVDLVYMVPFIALALLMYPMPEAYQIGGIIVSVAAFVMGGFCVWLGVDHARAIHWTRKAFSVLPAKYVDRVTSGIDKFTSGLGVLGRRELYDLSCVGLDGDGGRSAADITERGRSGACNIIRHDFWICDARSAGGGRHIPWCDGFRIEFVWSTRRSGGRICIDAARVELAAVDLAGVDLSLEIWDYLQKPPAIGSAG